MYSRLSRNGFVPLFGASAPAFVCRPCKFYNYGFSGVRGLFRLHNAFYQRSCSDSACCALGVDPYVICALGDWENFVCFRRFYGRVRALAPITQLLIKQRPTLASAVSSLSMRIVLCGNRVCSESPHFKTRDEDCTK